jgi:hypothetical protein
MVAGAITRFLHFSAGLDPTHVGIKGLPSPIRAGGGAALLAFVGHNGLMDMRAPVEPQARPGTSPRSSVVLACSSRPYFRDLLLDCGAHPLLLTTGRMAPEAYTLEAAVTAFAVRNPPDQVREAAASAYHRYQKCGMNGARRLFSSDP